MPSVKIMKVYTKKGDLGTTSLLGSEKVDKDDLRIEAYGTVDELNSVMGWISTFKLNAELHKQVFIIQNTLFNVGSVLAATSKALEKFAMNHVSQTEIHQLESWIDEQTNNLPALKSFILPGGSAENAACHLARTVCRRAERRVVSLQKLTKTYPLEVMYLNRLSDYLFTLARTTSKLTKSKEVIWSS
ncbi:MAG: cob(I)alamin adenosyltransferase [Bacteroidia bacterium]